MCQITSTSPENRHPRGSYQNAWVDIHQTRRGPSPHHAQPPLKTAGLYLQPPRSSACRSKMCQITSTSPENRHPRGSYQNAWVDIHQTRRGPSPHHAQPPLKTAGLYLQPPRSSACRSKMCQITSTSPENRHPRGSYQNAWVDIHQTRRRPSPDQGPPPPKTAGVYLQPPQRSACRSKMCQITSRSRRPWTRPRPRGRWLLACLSQPPWHFVRKSQR